MVAEGKISAEDAAKLLGALREKPRKKGRNFHILITESGKKNPKLDLSIPVKFAKLGLKFIPKNSKLNAHLGNTDFDFSTIDWQEILELVTAGEVGELFHLDVKEENNEQLTIRIFVD